MPRLLLVTYHFPPEPAAGALRAKFLASYLPEFGWDVTVLTRPLGRAEGVDCEIVSAAVMDRSIEQSVRRLVDGGDGHTVRPSRLRRSLRRLRETLWFPDRTAGWLPGALREGLRTSGNRRFDAVIGTAMPATVLVVAAAIAARRGLPWIADYRDPWSGNAYVIRGPIRRALERRLETSLLRTAAAVTTVSPAVAQGLTALHGRDVTVIPNASDPSDWLGLEPVRPERFELCFTGSMYDGRRSPKLLFEAIASLRDENDAAADALIVFYGPNSECVAEIARRHGLEDIVELRGTVPRPDALRAQRRASALLVFLNMDPATAHELGSKVFEYSGARRPIVAFGPSGSAVRTYLAQTGLGWFAGNLSEAKAALRNAYRHFSSGASDVTAAAAPFEARDLARAFASKLDAIVRGPAAASSASVIDAAARPSP